jgi:hypothetical protein
MTTDTTDELNRYLNVWTNVLETFLGWSDAQVKAWAAPFLIEDADLTLHEPPTFWVAPVLIPDDVASRLNSEQRAGLAANIQYALDGGNAFWVGGPEDIKAAQARVIDLLGR